MVHDILFMCHGTTDRRHSPEDLSAVAGQAMCMRRGGGYSLRHRILHR